MKGAVEGREGAVRLRQRVYRICLPRLEEYDWRYCEPGPGQRDTSVCSVGLRRGFNGCIRADEFRELGVATDEVGR